MRKKKCQSVEHVITSSTKGSAKLLFNPRLGKSKIMKSNTQNIGSGDPYSNTCPASPYSALTVGNVNLHQQYAYNNESIEDIRPWEKLRHTFSTRKSPIMSSKLPSSSNTTSSRLKNVDIVAESQEHDLSSVSQTTDIGVQVSLFHCKDCRRHVKYGKTIECPVNETFSGEKPETEESSVSEQENTKKGRKSLDLDCSNLFMEDNDKYPNVIPKEQEKLHNVTKKLEYTRYSPTEETKETTRKRNLTEEVPNTRRNPETEESKETERKLTEDKQNGTANSFEPKHSGFVSKLFGSICVNESAITSIKFVLLIFFCVLCVFIIFNMQYFLKFVITVEDTPTFYDKLTSLFYKIPPRKPFKPDLLKRILW